MVKDAKVEFKPKLQNKKDWRPNSQVNKFPV